MNAADTPRSAIDDPPTGPTRCCDRVVEDLVLEELLTWVEALSGGVARNAAVVSNDPCES